jgi:hypothetical protein
MPTLKSLHDLRTVHSVRTRPVSDIQAYLELNRLAGERKRLERELELGIQKIERIHRRMDEIEEQMHEHMQGLGYTNGSVEAAAPRRDDKQATAPEGKLRQVTLEY